VDRPNKISGTQFNGLSQAAAFGDEVETATNYPLVRITNNSTGHVFYTRTHDHSTMGVATGNTPVSTNFDVPSAWRRALVNSKWWRTEFRRSRFP